MIEVKDLSYSYGKEPVLENVSFLAGEKDLIAILGPNGVGKSTLFKCILGFFPKYQGSIRYGGKEVVSLSRKELALEAAYIPQSSDPIFNYTVYDTVLMGTTASLSLFGTPGRKQKEAADRALSLLHIENLRDRGIRQISGGERQLALIARAIVQKARILVMDEPTANLDYGNQQMVLSCIRELADQGYSVLFSTHNPDHALQYSTHVLAMKRDHSYCFGDTGTILNEELIRDVYDIPVRIVELKTARGIIKSCVPL